jgi:predicted HTH transcriptional regulator
MDIIKPFYISKAVGVNINDLSIDRMKWFINRVKTERNFILSSENNYHELLKELVLIEDNMLLNAALMLFGKNPQKYCPSAVIKCSHYYGTELSRPIPDQKMFEGDLFQQVDSALDFVMSKLYRTVGGRKTSATAEVKEEIPNEVVAEIIVNAVVHRDYDIAGSIQITIFADRIEIMNPGKLPKQLKISDLDKKHLSIPINPFLARPFYLAGYINQLGYGTLNVFKWCKKANLPEPIFEQLNHQFNVTIFRNWLTDRKLKEFDLNNRQMEAIKYLMEHIKITNTQYQEEFHVAKRTASKDLQLLTSLGLISKEGTTGKGVFYKIAKGASKGHKEH